MKEYKFLQDRPKDLEEAVNRYAKYGWEVHTFRFQNDGMDWASCLLVREKVDD